MFGWITSKAASTRAGNGNRARLELEALETRAVPSATGFQNTHLHLDTRVLFQKQEDFLHLPGVDETTQLVVAPASTTTGTQTLSSFAPEAEEHIAIGPTAATSNILVAAISDFSLRGGWNTTYYAISTDGGATYPTTAFVPRNSSGNLITSDGKVWYANSDPVVAINTSGTAYLADMYLVNPSFSLNNNNANGLYVSVLNTATHAISGTFAVVPPQTSASTTINYDKEWIAVDNTTSLSNSGRVYVSYTKFTSTSDAIYIATPSSMANLGAAWNIQQISLSSQNGAVQGSQVAVDKFGNIFVSYEVYYGGGQRQIFITKGTYNAGTGKFTFSTPIAATPVFKEVFINGSYRTDSFPAMAIDPTSGNVYLTYADQEGSNGAEVKFVYSTNGGATFSAPKTVNSIAAGQEFFPAISVDASTGNIWISWFDTHGTPNNNYYNIYASKLTLSGGTLTIAPESKVNSAGPYYAGASNGFIGDYAGIAAGNGAAHPVWTTGGFNNGKLATATIT